MQEKMDQNPDFIQYDLPNILDQFHYRYDIVETPWYQEDDIYGLIFFRVIMGTIVLNCITIGLEVEANNSPAYTAHDFEVFQSPYFWFNCIFAAIFMAELFIKFREERWLYFRSNWNVMDFVLVLISVVDLVVSTLYSSDDDQGSILKNLTLLRVLRIIRLMNVLTENLQALQVLVNAFASIVPVLLWANLVLAVLKKNPNDFFDQNSRFSTKLNSSQIQFFLHSK